MARREFCGVVVMGARLDASGVSRAPRMPELNVRAVLQLRHERKALIGKGKKKKLTRGGTSKIPAVGRYRKRSRLSKWMESEPTAHQHVSAKAAGHGLGWIGNGKGVGGEQASR